MTLMPSAKEHNLSIYSLLLLLIFFMPSASVIGGFQLWYVIIVLTVCVGLSRTNITFDNHAKAVYYFSITNFILLFLSILLSLDSYGSVKDTNETIRLIGLLGLFFLVYSFYHRDLGKKTLIFFKLFLVAQLVICFLQGFDFGIKVFGLIWNTERVWDLRRTGSFANPNILSIFCVAVYIYIYFQSSLKNRLIYGSVVLLIILFSSSKTGLLSFLAIACLNYALIKAKFNLKTVVLFLGSLTAILYLLVQLLYLFRDNYPYLAQILVFFENDMDISSIKSMGDRQVIWDNALSHYRRLPLIQKIFGIGPAKNTELNIIDNEFLTILLKMGWAGIIVFATYLWILLVYLFKNNKVPAAKTMIAVVALFLLASGSASTFIAWHLSLLFYFFLAICFKEIKLSKSLHPNTHEIIRYSAAN